MNSPNTSPPSSPTSSAWFGALGLTLVAAILAAIIMIGVRTALLYEGRVAVRDDAREANQRVALLAARVAGDDLSACTRALDALAVAGRSDPSQQLSNCLERFRAYAQAAPSSSADPPTDAQAVIVNEMGEAVFEALPSTACLDLPLVQRIVDAHKQSHASGLSVSTSTALCPAATGETNGLMLAQSIHRDDGAFAGVGIVTIDARYFTRLFADLTPGEHGVLSLLRNDGAVLVTSNPVSGSAPRDAAPSAIPALPATSSQAGASAGADGDFLYVRQSIEGLPLTVDIRAPKSDIYAEWRKRAYWVAAMTATLGVSCLILAVLLRRQRQRRQVAETALQRMASTDPLTGLANRRTLDEAYDREWRRALRERTALSLLFIDVDHFKQFNDRYGHPAGDDALIAVAGAITHSIRRPGDFAGRYGGEEFMVVLPNTDAMGARDVAERVRTAVHAAAIAHEDSQHRHVTVSIGVAGTGPVPTGTPERLLQAADEALYAAKHEGRDRVHIHANSGGDPCPAI
ncbi:sensor domain-containing diguanylate cyclase [Pandoraea pneumonica]|uniref:sensor domain-containing diguanylate cyclase n=1 Tax=Pandoraea pneumonica TaxID=2508299 RepID=UPI003CF2D65D